MLLSVPNRNFQQLLPTAEILGSSFFSLFFTCINQRDLF